MQIANKIVRIKSWEDIRDVFPGVVGLERAMPPTRIIMLDADCQWAPFKDSGHLRWTVTPEMVAEVITEVITETIAEISEVSKTTRKQEKEQSMSEDPKQSAGSLKDPMQLLPPTFLCQTSRALGSGAAKYGVYNWRTSDCIQFSTYAGAIMRHLTKAMAGEDRDKESGLTHVAHIAATCAVMLDADSVGRLKDDRPHLLVPCRPAKRPEA